MHGNRPGMTLRGVMEPTARDSSLFAEGGPTEATSPVLGLRASGTTTMRRLSEPLQRAPDDADPVSLDIPPMSKETLIAVLQHEAAEAKAARAAMEAEGGEPGEGGEIDAMFIESIIESAPEVVLLAVIKYLQSKQ